MRAMPVIVRGVGAAVVVVGAIGVASTLQLWDQRVYDQPPARRLTRRLASRLLWLAGLLGYLTVQDFTFIHLKYVGPGRVLIYVDTFILAVAFYWWTPTSCCWAGWPGVGSSPQPSRRPCA